MRRITVINSSLSLSLSLSLSPLPLSLSPLSFNFLPYSFHAGMSMISVLILIPFSVIVPCLPLKIVASIGKHINDIEIDKI